MTGHPTSTHDLSPAERRLVDAMTELRFGRFEFLRIERGELILDPWPTTVHDVKFGAADTATHRPSPHEFELKSQVVEFLAYVRSVDIGEIRCLDVRHGLPFTMEIEHGQPSRGGRRG
jgi:hypothetical protein